MQLRTDMMKEESMSNVRQQDALANETTTTLPRVFPEPCLGGFGEQAPVTESTSRELALVETHCVSKDGPKLMEDSP